MNRNVRSQAYDRENELGNKPSTWKAADDDHRLRIFLTCQLKYICFIVHF